MRKKVIVFLSEGGGGHRSVATSIKDILSPEYDVELNVPIDTFLSSLDPIKKWTRNRFSGESLYNFFLRKRWFYVISVYGYFGELIARFKKKSITRLMVQFLTETKPDLIISVFPYFNNSFLAAAEEVGLPFLISVCDLYTKHYLVGIKNPTYEKFYHTLFIDHELPKKLITQTGLKESQLLYSGLPVRKDFCEEKDVQQIKESFHIETTKPIVLIVMGYLGSESGIEYFKALQKYLTQEVHVVIILGKEPEIHQAFQKIEHKTPVHITYTKIHFTDRISDLFYIADIIITKSGGISVAEGLYMQKPMIIDWTKLPLSWEKMSAHLIDLLHLGYIAHSYKRAALQISEWLVHPETLKGLRENYKVLCPQVEYHSFLLDFVNKVLTKE